MRNLLSHDIFSHTMKVEESMGYVIIQLTKIVINNCIYRGFLYVNKKQFHHNKTSTVYCKCLFLY